MNALTTRALLSSALVLVLVLAISPASAETADTACSSAVTIGTGTAWDLLPGSARGGEIFAVQVEEPGLLAVQAVATGSDTVRTAWLRLLDSGCDDSAALATSPGSSLGSGIVDVREAGTVYFEAGAVDLRDDDLGLRLSTHLFNSPLTPIYGHDGGPDDDTEENDGEVMPITAPGGTDLYRVFGHDGGPDDDTEENDGEVMPITGSGGGATLQNVYGHDGGPDDDTEENDGEVMPITASGGGTTLQNVYGHDGGPDDDTEENDGEVMPITASGGDNTLQNVYGHDGGPDDDTEENDGEVMPSRRTNPRRGADCLGEPANDLAACATELRFGTVAEGDLDSASGFDQDYFAFQVGGLEQIAINVQTDAPLHLRLTDVFGRELTTRHLDPSTEATSFEVVLVPGRYYLRLDGASSPSSTYRLQLSSNPGS